MTIFNLIEGYLQELKKEDKYLFFEHKLTKLTKLTSIFGFISLKLEGKAFEGDLKVKSEDEKDRRVYADIEVTSGSTTPYLRVELKRGLSGIVEVGIRINDTLIEYHRKQIKNSLVDHLKEALK